MDGLRRRRSDRLAKRAVSSYWDEVLRRSPTMPVPPPDVPQELAAPIRRIHVLEQSSRSRAPFERQLLDVILSRQEERKTMTTHASSPVSAPLDVFPAPRFEKEGRRKPTSRGRLIEPGRPLSRYAALAAVLVLVVVSLTRLTPGLPGGDNSRPGGLSVFAPATPSPNTADGETLLEMRLPEDVLADQGPRRFLGVIHITIPPDTVATRDASQGTCCPGPKTEYILTGSVTFSSDGPARVLRSGRDGAPEDIAAGAEVVLEPGDTLMHRNEHGETWTTSAAEPVELLFWAFVGGHDSLRAPQPVGWVSHRGGHLPVNTDIPVRAHTVRLWQVDLEPDEAVPAPTGGAVQSAVTLPGETGYLVTAGDGSMILRGAETTTRVYVLTLQPLDDAAATPAASTPEP